MLIEIDITNFAIIDHLHLKFNPGFNALTGETGAGKSIIIDAMGAMLGAKIGAEFIRHGTNQARVEGYFELDFDPSALHSQRLLALLKDNELIDEPEIPAGKLGLTLARELNMSGRTTCRVNGSPVKQDILRAVGEILVDIHGQTEHVSLLRVSEHLELLDQYAAVLEQRTKLAEWVGQLRGLRKEITSLQRDERELARRVDLLRFQVEEIEAAALQPDEEENLQKERQLLNSAEKLTASAVRAYQVLYQGFDESEGEGGAGYGGGRGGKRGAGGGAAVQAIHQSLSEVEGLLTDLARYEPEFNKQVEVVQEVTYRLEDVAQFVRNFRDGIEHDPARLLDIEDRLELIRSLKRKYGATIPEVLAFWQNAAEELDKIEHSGERLAELQNQETKLLAKIGQLAGELSQKRQEASRKLATEVEQALRELKMFNARFEVNLTRSEDANGAPVKDSEGQVKRYAFEGRGIDRAEFYVSLNAGEPPKPLQKVASGGETARLMLALKSILAAADTVPTLIFDEVDVGVGGRSGTAVGEKLWQLTNHGQHQVLCITHLPQIAAFGDAHFNIVKQVSGQRTATTVRQLADEERVEEIAAMLGGQPITEAMRLSSVELIKEVKVWKDTARNGTSKTATKKVAVSAR